MALHFRNAFVRDAFPKDRAFVLVDRVDLPGVFGIVLDRRRVAEEAEASFILLAVDRSGDENLVAPDNGTRMGQTRNLDLPTHVLRRLRVPLHRLAGTFDNAGRTWATKLRPVLRGCGGYKHTDKYERD